MVTKSNSLQVSREVSSKSMITPKVWTQQETVDLKTVSEQTVFFFFFELLITVFIFSAIYLQVFFLISKFSLSFILLIVRLFVLACDRKFFFFFCKRHVTEVSNYSALLSVHDLYMVWFWCFVTQNMKTLFCRATF